MRSILKLSAVICCVFMIPGRGLAADTLKIHLTYKHKLDDAGRTQGFTTVNQKFYTPDQVLFREINYSEQNHQIESYIFYFYTGDKLSTEECYNQKDSLLFILKHEYDEAGKENQVLRFAPVNGSLEVTNRTVKSYDNAGHITRQKEYYGKKLGTSILYEYNNLGLVNRENHKFKSISKNPLKNKSKTFVYNPDNSVKQIIIRGKDAANNPLREAEDFTYNDKGLPASVKVTGTGQQAAMVKTYSYLDSGYLSLYQEVNGEGKINTILQYDYKKHYMDKGNQVSYFSRSK